MLTPKQKAFADYYIECGNASEAARRAGYSPKTAEKIGSENLQKPEISAYIQERMAQQDASRVASADEVLRFYSSVMRGQEKDAFGLDPSLADRLKAADSLMKRYAIGAEKQKGTLEKLDSLLKEMHDAAYMDT
jgi:phage terminase small subunit